MKTAKIKYFTSLLTALFIITSIHTGWAKHTDEKIKGFIDDVSDSLKHAVDSLGDDIGAIQNYLDNYHWKGVVQGEATSGPATLKHLQLNGHSPAAVVKPGEKVEAIVECNLNRDQCSYLRLYRIVVGIKGQGGQTTIGNELGLVAGESIEKFTLTAPQQPGIYQIRFKPVTGLFEESALEAWRDHNGKEPDGRTTIGILVVKP